MTYTKLLRAVVSVCGLAAIVGCATNSQRDMESVAVPAPTVNKDVADLGFPEMPVTEIDNPVIRLKAEQDYVLALGMMRNGKPSQAIKILNAFTKSYPYYAGPYANLGILYHRAGDLKAAERAFLKAIELKPDHTIAYNRLGMLYREQGRFGDAAEAYNKAIESDDESTDAYLNLGILYDIYLYDPRKAIKYYTQYQELVDERDEQVAAWISDIGRRVSHVSQAGEE